MSKDGISTEPEKVKCPMCNRMQNCDVLSRLEKSWTGHGGTYSILECRGCNQVFYRTVSWDENAVDIWSDENGEPIWDLYHSESIYPVGAMGPSCEVAATVPTDEAMVPTDEATATPSQSQTSKNPSKGGNPGKYDWALAVGTIVFQWADKGNWEPKSQSEVQKELGNWFSGQSQTPDDKLLKKYAQWLFAEFKKRKTE